MRLDMLSLKKVLAVSLVQQSKNDTHFSWRFFPQEGTQDCEGIGREMERVAERMGGTTKWPYNDSDCLDAVSWRFRKSIPWDFCEASNIQNVFKCT